MDSRRDAQQLLPSINDNSESVRTVMKRHIAMIRNGNSVVVPQTSSAEFNEIRMTSRHRVQSQSVPLPHSYGLLPMNYHKNRYRDIIPYEDNRVRLLPITAGDGNDYINASHINDKLMGEKYIAAQGPTRSTCFDFIRMIWEYQIEIVVCIVDEADQNDSKCFRYWPSTQNEEYPVNSFVIRSVSSSPEVDVTGNFIIRQLGIYYGDTVHKFIHIHFTRWPDRGCPLDGTEPILNLLDHIHAVKDNLIKSRHRTALGQNRPIMVVHCSAGCGRTGTLIAIDIIMNYFKHRQSLQQPNDESNQVLVFRIAKDLRRQRVGMIQTLEQYQFVYLAYHAIQNKLSTSKNKHRLLKNESKFKRSDKMRNPSPKFLGLPQSKNRANSVVHNRSTADFRAKEGYFETDEYELDMFRHSNSLQISNQHSRSQSHHSRGDSHSMNTQLVPSIISTKRNSTPLNSNVHSEEDQYVRTWKSNSVARNHLTPLVLSQRASIAQRRER
ncbi:hypothetical protein ACOME3_004969 [Neoechinorhynchus agilis]